MDNIVPAVAGASTTILHPPFIKGLNSPCKFRMLILAILAIVFPPLAIFITKGCNRDLAVNFLLTLLAWVPGVLHAFWVLAGRSGDVVGDLETGIPPVGKTTVPESVVPGGLLSHVPGLPLLAGENEENKPTTGAPLLDGVLGHVLGSHATTHTQSGKTATPASTTPVMSAAPTGDEGVAG